MPTIASQPSLQNTQAVGAILLHQFARERFLEAGINENLIQEAEAEENLDRLVANLVQDCDSDRPQEDDSFKCIEDDVSDSMVEQQSDTTTSKSSQCHHSLEASNYTNSVTAKTIDKLQSSSLMSHYGKQLKQIAEEFEKSRERKMLKENADSVELSDITKENFMKLLEELFQDKITRERIVILFFFCTDIALRAASFAQELVVKLLGWSFSYIINTVCRVVHELGGWEHVLFRQLPSLLITCCAALGICALAVYLRKSLMTQSV